MLVKRLFSPATTRLLKHLRSQALKDIPWETYFNEPKTGLCWQITVSMFCLRHVGPVPVPVIISIGVVLVIM